MENETITIVVTQENKGKRLDKLIFDYQNGSVSRTQIQKLIDEEYILVNCKKATANYKVRLDDKIVITEKEPENYDVIPVDLNLDIVYEDSFVAVVDKPSGMTVHPANTTHEPTLVHGLMYQIKDLSGIGGVMRPGIVHRIDKDTSGLLMVAKNDIAHESLVTQLKNKTVTRRYTALVYGSFDHTSGKITAPIGRDKEGRLKMAVVEDGKDAVTNFKVIEKFKDYTLIECQLETGRTHQIRVHLSYINHPIVGDPIYGPRKVIGDHGQYLHAGILGFNHPSTNEYLEFKSPLPNYFNELLEDLRSKQ